jgi:hypothetical protein
MKTNFISILSLLAILSFNACNKPVVEEPEIISCISDDGFKGEYFNASSLKSNYQINEGNNRVFVASKKETSWENRFYFIAPNSGNSFNLNSNDIKNGLVKYLFICPACNFIIQSPIDGFVKGENITPEKPINETTWMIDAKIILTTDLSQPNHSKFRDTVCIKQVFYPSKTNKQ